MAQYPEEGMNYKVVINDEEQYSIWPADRENPLGWNDAGKSGTKDECLAYIRKVWSDMRPLSLKKKIEEGTRGAGVRLVGSLLRSTIADPEQNMPHPCSV